MKEKGVLVDYLKQVRVMLSQRIISAIFGIILFILFIVWGSLPFTLMVGLITILAVNEFNRLLPHGDKRNGILIGIFSLFIIYYTYLTNSGVIKWPHGVIFFLILSIYLFLHIIIYSYQDIVSIISKNLFGLIYLGGGMSFFILLRDFNTSPFNQTKALWLVLVTTWATDTGAYFLGRFLGKRKLAPNISPNKTIEGAVGGILFSIIAVLIFTSIIHKINIVWIIYAIFASIISMAGDLFESSIKRDMGVKDSGNLIPGHGGILDRFDSLLFALPFTYYFLKWFLTL